MTVDYEAEYDNRARVKEHPEILARLAADAAAFRAQAVADGRAELGVSYGPSERQFLDIFLSRAGPDAPLALFIHGGYWRSMHPHAFSSLARGLVENGVTVAVAGYDLCPAVGIADIVAQIERACLLLWDRYRKRILVYGHSAGGHLAAAMLATDWQRHGAGKDLVPAALAISGLFDLAPMIATSMNVDFKLDVVEARRLSPLFLPPPAGLTLEAIVGGAESDEYHRQSREIVARWGDAGVRTRYEAKAGANHFTIVEPLADPDSAIVQRLVALVPR